jgi:hypothetical protein
MKIVSNRLDDIYDETEARIYGLVYPIVWTKMDKILVPFHRFIGTAVRNMENAIKNEIEK